MVVVVEDKQRRLAEKGSHALATRCETRRRSIHELINSVASSALRCKGKECWTAFHIRFKVNPQCRDLHIHQHRHLHLHRVRSGAGFVPNLRPLFNRSCVISIEGQRACA